MSDEQTQADFLGDIAAAATGSVGVPDDVTVDDAVPCDLAESVEQYQNHADRRDEHLQDADQGSEEPAAEQDGRKQQVPLGALQKERAARQQAQAQLAQMQAQLQQLQAQQQQASAQQQTAQQQAEIPAFVDDPEGHLEGLKKQFTQELETLRQGQQQVQQEAQFRQQVVEAADFTTKGEAEFRQTQPDYDQATAFMDELAKAEIRRSHPGATDLEAQQIQATAMLHLAMQCQREGVNPAAVLYQQAVAHGFQTSHRRTQPTRKAPTSLADVSGSTRAPDQRGNVSAKDIANMSNADFDKFFNEMAAGANQRPAF